MPTSLLLRGVRVVADMLVVAEALVDIEHPPVQVGAGRQQNLN
jgi:hypothetical protein